MASLEDLISGHLSDKGFRIISRDDLLNAVSSFSSAGPNAGNPALAGSQLDALMSNNTSALRLAQNLNADCILVASISTYGMDEIDYNDPDSGVSTKIDEFKMTISYKLLDVNQGGSLTGGVIEVTKKDRAQPGLTISRDYIDDLMTDASAKLADAMEQKFAEGQVAPIPQPNSQLVSFTATCGMGDLFVPEIQKDEDGTYQVQANTYQVEAMNVTVALDGVALGTTPGPFQALPGLHKIRLSRDGFNDWEQTINIRDGLKLNVDLTLSPAGYARWADTAAFLQGLKENDKLTDARVQVLQGYAQELSQSGFRIDSRSNIDVNKNIIVDKNINVNNNSNYSNVPEEQQSSPPPAAQTAPPAPAAPAAPAAPQPKAAAPPPAPTSQPAH